MLDSAPDWESYRREFPVTENLVYFNSAGTGPLPLRTSQAMQRMAEEQVRFGGRDWSRWMESVDAMRASAAQLIGAQPDQIAVTKNTSEALSFLAQGLEWRPGDAVVAARDDFPANYLPWARLEARGVKLRWLDTRGGRLDLNDIDEACAGARLLAVSFVDYLTGFRLDLDAVGEIARRRGCLLAVDAVQGLGPFPVDVGRSGVDLLSASGHKWLVAPEGAAIGFFSQRLMEQLDPPEFGWMNVAGYDDHSKVQNLRAGAARYECGTLNTIGCFGLRASIELFLEIGVRNTALRVDGLAQRLAAGAREKGFQLAVERDSASGSGIVSFAKEGVDMQAMTRRLADEGVSVAYRRGMLRAAPHFYNTNDEVDRLLSLI